MTPTTWRFPWFPKNQKNSSFRRAKLVRAEGTPNQKVTQETWVCYRSCLYREIFSQSALQLTTKRKHFSPPSQLPSLSTVLTSHVDSGLWLPISLSASTRDLFTVLNLQIINQIRSLLQWLSSSGPNLNLNKSTGSYMSSQSQPPF